MKSVLGEKLWEASAERKANSQMARFSQRVASQEKIDLGSWEKLYKWSISDTSSFWKHLAEFAEIKWRQEPKEILKKTHKQQMLGVEWFPGARLNFAENLLPSPSDKEAIISITEQGNRKVLTRKQLYDSVVACHLSLKKMGVKKGDRVAGVLANSFEAVVIMLATTSLGAVWSSCSPDFGKEGIIDRFGQIEPKIVFFQRFYSYNGKIQDCQKTIAECCQSLDKSYPVIVDPDANSIIKKEDLGISFNEFLRESLIEEPRNGLNFEPMEFHDPLFILYSSGTTGKPKAIVHGVGGTLLQHKKELMLHGDLQEDDRLFYFTTCGWMMWNWAVSTLSLGLTLITYDGSPSYPNLETLWNIVAKEKLSAFGTSPKFIASCIAEGLYPAQKFDLGSLKTIFSTGSPLLPEHFDWVYDRVHPDVHLASISGGTDIISCFMLGNPLLPVCSGEIQAAGLGMDIEAWDDQGSPLIEHKGELVCKKPFVSMPIYFFNDPEQKKYRQAYFEYFSGREVWRHGDFIEISARGSIRIFGRSDATLNPGGVRIGTSEIYRQIEIMEEINDALAIGMHRNDDVEVILFVLLDKKYLWNQELMQKVKQQIRKELTPRHVPKKIFPVKDIPYTRSGKKVELAVTRIFHGEELDNLTALANPESLKEFYTLAGQVSV